MPRFGVVPPEVPVQRDLNLLAPAFRAAVDRVLARLAGGPIEWPFETLRTRARQDYLIGFGRDYDDGRGLVTGRLTVMPLWWKSWHVFGLAIDLVEKDTTPWNAPESFWMEICTAGEAEGLVSGLRWPHPDRPHLQWGRCPTIPTIEDTFLLRRAGLPAVWEKYGALVVPAPL